MLTAEAVGTVVIPCVEGVIDHDTHSPVRVIRPVSAISTWIPIANPASGTAPLFPFADQKCVRGTVCNIAKLDAAAVKEDATWDPVIQIVRDTDFIQPAIPNVV